MNLITLKYFIEVAKNKNFTKTAIENHISQTAISQQIKKLEEELDTKLFNRSKLPIELTATGERVFRRAQIILDQYEMMQIDIQEIKTKKYIFRLGYSNSFLVPLEKFVIPSLTQTVDDNYFLEEFDGDTVQDLLLRKMIDFALCYESDITNRSEIGMLTVNKGNLKLVLSRENEFFKKKDLGILRNQTLITIRNNLQSNAFNSLKQQLIKEKIVFKDFKSVKSIESALVETSMNKGIMVVPDFFELRNNLNLTTITLDKIELSYKTCLAYRKHNKKVQEILPLLKEKLISKCL